MTTESTTALSVRDLDRLVAERFRAGARARGITQAEYLERLLDLHDRLRADATGKPLGYAKTTLARCNLTSVTY